VIPSDLESIVTKSSFLSVDESKKHRGRDRRGFDMGLMGLHRLISMYSFDLVSSYIARCLSKSKKGFRSTTSSKMRP
jgi:hypothetical protein